MPAFMNHVFNLFRQTSHAQVKFQVLFQLYTDCGILVVGWLCIALALVSSETSDITVISTQLCRNIEGNNGSVSSVQDNKHTTCTAGGNLYDLLRRWHKVCHQNLCGNRAPWILSNTSGAFLIALVFCSLILSMDGVSFLDEALKIMHNVQAIHAQLPFSNSQETPFELLVKTTLQLCHTQSGRSEIRSQLHLEKLYDGLCRRSSIPGMLAQVIGQEAFRRTQRYQFILVAYIQPLITILSSQA